MFETIVKNHTQTETLDQPVHLTLPHNHNEKQLIEPSSHNFTVATRIKPCDPDEPNFKVILNKNHKEIHIESSKHYKNSYSSKSKNFNMNNIFPQNTLNSELFSELVQPKLALLKKNCNVSVMAYGATNSGKTHTIFGSETYSSQNRGLAYLCGDHIINSIFKEGFKYYFSYLQIYNENVQDLLSQKEEKKHYLNIFEDHNGKINIPDLTKVQIQSQQHLEQLIEKGNAVRAEASSHLNQRSSRSHALLQIDIFSVQDQASPVTQTPIDVNFMIIDLAGSEKSSPYLQEGHQSLLKEGGNINRSLLALGNCITNLSNGEQHIPYRDSKLTRILKDNLSGYCHNIMIACVSQNLSQYEQTINTLQYASKAYKIENYISNQIKNRSQYVNIPCEHCHMTMDFSYLSKILKHYSYDLIDLLGTGPNLSYRLNQSKSLKKVEERSKHKKRRDRSTSSKKEKTKGLKKSSVSVDKTEKFQKKPPSLRLNYKKAEVSPLQLKNNRSQQALYLTLATKKEQQPIKDFQINVWQDYKHTPQTTLPSKIKFSINSKKTDSNMNDQHQEHSIFPFMEEEENGDMNQLYSKQRPHQQGQLKYERTFRAVLKRNSEPRQVNLINKENDFNYINIQEEEQGPKTTRDEPKNMVEQTKQNSSLFYKAAKRMKPDTLEPLIRSLSPEPAQREKSVKQRIKIITKLR